jgi:hypothetical protein
MEGGGGVSEIILKSEELHGMCGWRESGVGKTGESLTSSNRRISQELQSIKPQLRNTKL